MRIVAVDTFVLRHALGAPFGSSQGWYDARTALLVRVTLPLEPLFALDRTPNRVRDALDAVPGRHPDGWLAPPTGRDWGSRATRTRARATGSRRPCRERGGQGDAVATGRTPATRAVANAARAVPAIRRPCGAPPRGVPHGRAWWGRFSWSSA